MAAELRGRSLLPARLPTHPRLALAARYLPAGQHAQAGGDWYDVIIPDGDRVAIVAGDVVGNGPGAAAVMGQLRSALAGFLLEGHTPSLALQWLSRLAGRIDGALGSTAICLVLHTGSGELYWARAGHPPPAPMYFGSSASKRASASGPPEAGSWGHRKRERKFPQRQGALQTLTPKSRAMPARPDA